MSNPRPVPPLAPIPAGKCVLEELEESAASDSKGCCGVFGGKSEQNLSEVV